MKQLTIMPDLRKMRIPLKHHLLLFCSLVLFFESPLQAQDTKVPRTPTFPGIENPAFPYVQPEEVGMSGEKLNRLGDEIESWVANGDLVGGELLIIKDGKAIFHEAYGWADREERRPMERNSIYFIDGMTKPFTATAILLLEEQNLLSTDETVSKFIKTFPDDTTKIHHLLTQRSGFNWIRKSKHSDVAIFNSRRDWIEALATDKRLIKAGAFKPSDYNYVFLGQVIQEVTGKPVEEFIKSHIIRPLALGNTFTSYTPDESWTLRMNSRYIWSKESKKFAKYWAPGEKKRWPYYPGANNIYTSAMDYAKLMHMWMNKGKYARGFLISEESIDKAFRLQSSVQDFGYGFGWTISNSGTPQNMPSKFFHGGQAGTTAIAFPPTDGIIIYLTQSMGGRHQRDFFNMIGKLKIFDSEETPPKEADYSQRRGAQL